MSVDARDALGDRGALGDGEEVQEAFLDRSRDHCHLHQLMGEGLLDGWPSPRSVRAAEGQEPTGIWNWGRLTADQETGELEADRCQQDQSSTATRPDRTSVQSTGLPHSGRPYWLAAV